MSSASLEARRPALPETDSPGLAYWRAASYGQAQIDPVAYRRLTSHPNFARACIQVTQQTLDRRHSEPALTRLMIDVQRAMLCFFVLYLDARGGITLGAIHDLVRELGLASPGRATAMLVSLRVMGYVTPDPIQPDRRSRRYIPTALTRAAVGKSFRYRGLAFALIEPEAMRIAERFDNAAVFKAYVLQLGEGISDVLKRGNSSGTLDHFGRANAGLGILFYLSIAIETGDVFPPRRPIPVSINALATEFKVSRAHVRKLLRGAEEKGLITRDADASTVTLSEQMRESIIEYQAANFFAYASCACAALRAVGEAPR